MTKKSVLLGVLVLLPGLVTVGAEARRVPAKNAGFTTQSDWPNVRKDAGRLSPFRAARCSGGAGAVCGIAVRMDAKCDPNRKPDPEILGVMPQHKIIWHIDSPQWDFDGDGIEFIDNPSAALDKQGNGNRVRQYNVKAEPASGVYRYRVHLIDRDGNKCAIDPGIWV